ncbi:hypothetical protein ES708_11779 [subsurface metagenome]
MSAPSNIEIHGPLSRDDFSRVIIDYDCLVIPSCNEGQPIVILEAMSLGVPVISTRVGDIPNMLGEGYPFLSRAKDVSSLRDVIISFNDYDHKYELGEELNERYHLHYSNKNHEDKLGQIFRSKDIKT